MGIKAVLAKWESAQIFIQWKAVGGFCVFDSSLALSSSTTQQKLGCKNQEEVCDFSQNEKGSGLAAHCRPNLSSDGSEQSLELC